MINLTFLILLIFINILFCVSLISFGSCMNKRNFLGPLFNEVMKSERVENEKQKKL